MGDAPLSAEETAILLDFFLEIQPSRVLTIHQPLNGIDYDGPAKDLAHELHLSCLISGFIDWVVGSGSLGSFVGKDLQRNYCVRDTGYANERSAEWLWARYGALLRIYCI